MISAARVNHGTRRKGLAFMPGIGVRVWLKMQSLCSGYFNNPMSNSRRQETNTSLDFRAVDGRRRRACRSAHWQGRILRVSSNGTQLVMTSLHWLGTSRAGLSPCRPACCCCFTWPREGLSLSDCRPRLRQANIQLTLQRTAKEAPTLGGVAHLGGRGR